MERKTGGMGNNHAGGTIKVVLIGLASTGKTHFLFTIKYGDSCGARKTTGYNEEMMVHEGYRLHFVDIGASVPNAPRGHFKGLPKNLIARLINDVGCLYFFVDGEDDDEALLIAKSQLLALITNESFKNVPVAIIQNVKPCLREVGGKRKRRSWGKLRDGMEVEKLSTWMKIFVTDLSYTESKPLDALLEFTIKHGISH